MDPKLTILFMLITAVVVLSHLTDENLTRDAHEFAPAAVDQLLAQIRAHHA